MPVIQMATTFTTVIPLTTDLLSRTWFYRIEWSIHFMLLTFVVIRTFMLFIAFLKHGVNYCCGLDTAGLEY